MYTLKIKITEEVIERSLYCGVKSLLKEGQNPDVSTHCAFAEALREIFPQAVVGVNFCYPFGNPIKEVLNKIVEEELLGELMTGSLIFHYRSPYFRPNVMKRTLCIFLSTEMQEFIRQFDTCCNKLDIKTLEDVRRSMIGQEFELELPDYIIDHIDIDEIKEVLKKTPHLEIV